MLTLNLPKLQYSFTLIIDFVCAACYRTLLVRLHLWLVIVMLSHTQEMTWR